MSLIANPGGFNISRTGTDGDMAAPERSAKIWVA
jgi:hypothetical protein